MNLISEDDMRTILIGIAGGTGSGKTTLADKLVENFGNDEVSILRHDNSSIFAYIQCAPYQQKRIKTHCFYLTKDSRNSKPLSTFFWYIFTDIMNCSV